MTESISFSEEAAALRAFSKQSTHFDADDQVNPIIVHWRKKIYQHVDEFLQPSDRILELNSGTGIDARHFAMRGHHIHATDGSGEMIHEIQKKITNLALGGLLTSQQIAFNQLSEVNGKFDYVFSNFGGLNCISDLSQVAKSVSSLLQAQGHITWVIMPPFSPWEFMWIFKGKFKMALRRFSPAGSLAHLEGHYFKTYYHSLSAIREALGKDFKLVKIEGLGVISPPPASLLFVKNFSRITALLQRIESKLGGFYPFNRWGDHIIITVKYEPHRA